MNNDKTFNNTANDSSEPSFEDLLNESFSKPEPTIKVGDKVNTKIVAMDGDNIYLDLGTRMEGVVKKLEYLENGELLVKEGDSTTVYVVGKRGGMFQCARQFSKGDSISREVGGESVPYALKDAFNNSVPVEGKVESVNKGGFEVTVMGAKSFCPISQIELNYCDDPNVHLQKTYKFKITRLEEDGKNIVLSRKELLMEDKQKKADKAWEEIQEGQIHTGTVSNVQKYGAFINIGGVDGLLHVSEISHSRIEDAQGVIKEGETLTVEVISVDRIKRKIGLSLKSQMEDPWESAMKKITIGDEITGKVIRMKAFGAFVEIMPGLVGLLHISRLGTGKHHQHPKEVLSIGDSVSVRILELNDEKQTISLTMEKEAEDRSTDMARIKEEQEKKLNAKPGYMENLLDSALDDKNKES